MPLRELWQFLAMYQLKDVSKPQWLHRCSTKLVTLLGGSPVVVGQRAGWAAGGLQTGPLRLVAWMMLALGTAPLFAEPTRLPAGFQRVQGTHVDVITDMPLDDDLRELTNVFDAAMPAWCQTFGMQLEQVADWHVEAFIMLDRERFRQAGLIPEHLPNFPYGFQFGDRVWVAEQPSAYYRRHLLLHEGTHWFMNRKFGRSGPPWLMEGMAEWLGTHDWKSGQLTLGIIPEQRDSVPYWGRISLIQEQLADGSAPSLESILRYSDTAHQQVAAYAWSWAVVLFLQHHPETQATFQKMWQQPMQPDLTLTRWLFAQLKQDWPRLREDWNAFLSDLEYGYRPDRGFLVSSPQPSPLKSQPVELEIRADHNWQSSGVYVTSPGRVQIVAEGRYSVGREPADWICEPQGVTLEYYRGRPLGQLIMAVAAPLPEEPPHSSGLNITAVGRGGTVTIAEPGELFFKVNEASSGLADNAGTLKIVIHP